MSRSSWAVAFLVLAGIFFAAPLSVRAQNWKGLYAGVNVGATSGTFQDPVTIGAVSSLPATTESFDAHSTAFTAGAQVGYDWEFHHLVAGPEADFNWRNLNGTETVSTSVNNFVVGDSFSAVNHYQGSVVGRVGWDWGKWLIYGVGGAAIAPTTVTTNFVAIGQFPAATGSARAILVGPTVGVGLTRKIKGHLLASVEYRYSPYRHYTFSTGPVDSYINQSGAFLVSQVSASAGLHQSEFLLKLNYKF